MRTLSSPTIVTWLCAALGYSRCHCSLFYPTNSAYGLFAAIAVPLDLPHQNVFMSYNFEANYNQPATWGVPPVLTGLLDIEDARMHHGCAANCTIAEGRTATGDDVTNRQRRSALLTRTHFYYILEHKFQSHGLAGEACLLRLICEANAAELSHNNGVLGSIMHIMFAPSSSQAEPHLDNSYYQAEYEGRHGCCVRYMAKCGDSVLNHISTETLSEFLIK